MINESIDRKSENFIELKLNLDKSQLAAEALANFPKSTYTFEGSSPDSSKFDDDQRIDRSKVRKFCRT